MDDMLFGEGAKRQREAALTRPPSEGLHVPSSEPRHVVPKKDRLFVSSGAKRQKEAAFARPAYKGSQVPRSVLSRADALKQQQRSRSSQKTIKPQTPSPNGDSTPLKTAPAQTSNNESSSISKQNDVAEDSHGLLHTTINSPSLPMGLEVTQIKHSDKYGYVYQVREPSNGAFYEIRVYSFSQKDAAERRHVKRNCREWKERRRFLASWKEKDLVFLILRHPGDTRVPSLPRSLKHWGLSLESFHLFKRLKHSWEDDSDPLEEEKKQISSPFSIVMKTRFSGADVASEQGDSQLRSLGLFMLEPSTKTAAQKERDRKIQQMKRKRKRTNRRVERGLSTAHLGQPESNSKDSTTHQPQQPLLKGQDPYYDYLGFEMSTDTDPNLFLGDMRNKLQQMEDDGSTFPDGQYRQSTYSWGYSPYGGHYDSANSWSLNGSGGYRQYDGTFLSPYTDYSSSRWKDSPVSVFSISGYSRQGGLKYKPGKKFEPAMKTPTESKDDPAKPSTDNPPMKATPTLKKTAPTAAPELPKKYGTAVLKGSTLSALVKMLLEYLFSPDNLRKDDSLCQQMDPKGFVLINFLAGLIRIRRLTRDIDVIRLCCEDSNVLEVGVSGDGKGDVHVRRKEGWEEWVLVKEGVVKHVEVVVVEKKVEADVKGEGTGGETKDSV